MPLKLTHDFHGFELLLLKRLQTDQALWHFLCFEWVLEIQNRNPQNHYDCHYEYENEKSDKNVCYLPGKYVRLLV